MALKRITQELSDLSESPVDNASAGPVGDDPFHCRVSIVGPEGCPFEGDVFFLDLDFPQDYPFKPPKIQFIEPVIFHPNVLADGTMPCFALLRENWNPVFTIRLVLKTLSECLQEPADVDCCSVNKEAGSLAKRDPAAFQAKAHEVYLQKCGDVDNDGGDNDGGGGSSQCGNKQQEAPQRTPL